MKFGPFPMPEVDSNRPVNPQTELGKRLAGYNNTETDKHVSAKRRYESNLQQTFVSSRQTGKSIPYGFVDDLDDMWVSASTLDHVSWSEVDGPDYRPLCIYKTSQNNYRNQLWLITKEELHRIRGWFEVDTGSDDYSTMRRLDECLKKYSAKVQPQNGSAAIVVDLIKIDSLGTRPRMLKSPRTARVWFQDEADAVDFSMRVKSDRLRFGVPYLYDEKDRNRAKPPKPTRPWW